MDKNEKWLEWAVELQSIAQAGLYYCKDEFDKERYERIRSIAAEMIAYKSKIPIEKVSPIARSLPYISCELEAIKIPRYIIVRKRIIMNTHPTKPHSSAITAKIKSVWHSGRYARF